MYEARERRKDISHTLFPLVNKKAKNNGVNSYQRENRIRILQFRYIGVGSRYGNIDTFSKKTYQKDYSLLDARNRKNGYFKAIYSPQEKKLNIELPISFTKDSNQEIQDFFISNVHDTWSEKYQLVAGVRPIEWGRKLNPVDVVVTAKRENSLHNNGFEISITKGKTSYVSSDNVNGQKFTATLTEDAYKQTKQGGYNIYGHEAGHMFGLDDEYKQNEKYHIDHYKLTKTLFGKKYANRYAIPKDALSHSIMYKGKYVLKHHYVTFWDAMVQALQTEFKLNTDDKNNFPILHSDWYII